MANSFLKFLYLRYFIFKRDGCFFHIRSINFKQLCRVPPCRNPDEMCIRDRFGPVQKDRQEEVRNGLLAGKSPAGLEPVQARGGNLYLPLIHI